MPSSSVAAESDVSGAETALSWAADPHAHADERSYAGSALLAGASAPRLPCLMARRLTVGGLIIVALLAVTYRAAYGSWNVPAKIGYCDRSYRQADSGLTLDEVHERESQTSLPGASPYPVVEVGHAPPLLGRQIVAARTPESRRDHQLPCAVVIYLKTGDDIYTSYELQGGP